MSEPTPANLQLAIALPLGVVTNQLTKIEADLRFLSMKTAAFADQRDNGELAAKVAGGLEKINEALDRIRALVADMETHIQPPAAGPAGKFLRDRSRKSSADRDD